MIFENKLSIPQNLRSFCRSDAATLILIHHSTFNRELFAPRIIFVARLTLMNFSSESSLRTALSTTFISARVQEIFLTFAETQTSNNRLIFRSFWVPLCNQCLCLLKLHMLFWSPPMYVQIVHVFIQHNDVWWVRKSLLRRFPSSMLSWNFVLSNFLLLIDCFVDCQYADLCNIILLTY